MSSAASPSGACACCLARSWLLARLAAHLDLVRARIESVLALGDEDLITAIGGEEAAGVRRELEAVDPQRMREHAAACGLELLCRCAPRYPRRLLDLENPPAVLHVAGGLDRFLALIEHHPVAIVGARRASPYGLDVARALGRGLGASGITVVSGMALGIDSAAHAGALSTAGTTVAVMPGGADRAYPTTKRALHRRIVSTGAAVSELVPGTRPRRWQFPARNRLIAALAEMTIVVEAGERSGALITARVARSLDRVLGAVPGRVTTPAAAGPNSLLADGAHVIRSPQDVLDCLFGVGERSAPADPRPKLTPELRSLLCAIADGHDTTAALERVGFAPEQGLAALASLELDGYVRREPGGRFSVSA